MKYKKTIDTNEAWVGYVSMKDYLKIKKNPWAKLRWKLNPFAPTKIKVYRRSKK